jgi:hypothetical protein
MIPFLGILFFFYITYVLVNISATRRIRKKCKVGDICNVYIGENKLNGFIMKVNDEIDVWVTNKIIRFRRDQIYA